MLSSYYRIFCMKSGGRILIAIRRRLQKAAGGPQHRCHDLRESSAGALEAYYEKDGEPCIVNVALDECRWIGASGLSYSHDSLHPYIRTLVDYGRQIHTTYEGSYLERYWAAWTPSNLAEYLGLDAGACHPLLARTPPLHDILPWSPSDRISYMQEERWMRRSDYRALCEAGAPPARSCGPKPEWFGTTRFARLVSIYESIKQNGYVIRDDATLPHWQRHIVVKCLVRGSDVRLVVAHGQHRASALSALGYETVPAVVHSGSSRGAVMVRRGDAAHWPLVRRGIFSQAQALSIFDRIFDAVPPGDIRTRLSASRPV